MPNDPNLFRGATAVVDVAPENRATAEIGNSFPEDWKRRKDCTVRREHLSMHDSPRIITPTRTDDINFRSRK